MKVQVEKVNNNKYMIRMESYLSADDLEKALDSQIQIPQPTLFQRIINCCQNFLNLFMWL